MVKRSIRVALFELSISVSLPDSVWSQQARPRDAGAQRSLFG